MRSASEIGWLSVAAAVAVDALVFEHTRRTADEVKPWFTDSRRVAVI